MINFVGIGTWGAGLAYGSVLGISVPSKKEPPLPAPEELEEKILFELGLDENYSGK